MLNKLLAFVRQYDMVHPGDHIICAVSGGADSMALLFAMYLLKQKLKIDVSAAHFNHQLRGAESDRDAEFVKDFCSRHEIPLHLEAEQVIPGKKGLEAAARDARYRFLRSLPGKIATAHTANDNAETVLMHMVRGTGLKGLGAIAPVSDHLIRPMLSVTREDVLQFLDAYHIPYVEDSTNETDAFLRNRIRHNVMPLLAKENPKLAENLSAMALRLREDAALLLERAERSQTTDVFALRELPASERSQVLSNLLKSWGVCEPSAEHILQLERVVFSDKPSARVSFANGVVIGRNYHTLQPYSQDAKLDMVTLPCPGEIVLAQHGLRIACAEAEAYSDNMNCFTVCTVGPVYLRARREGDCIRLPGGTKSLKKLFIDRKIPAMERSRVPVLADDLGVLWVYGFGPNRDRLADTGPALEIQIEELTDSSQSIKKECAQQEVAK